MTPLPLAPRRARIAGIAAPLPRDNVDTDAIIRSRDIDRVAKVGFGARLFAAWRFQGDSGAENPDFVLNRPAYRGATILIAGKNFGCGSSREAAVWALADFGFQAVIACGFGAIFQANCVANGLAPVVLAQAHVDALTTQTERAGGDLRVVIDLWAGVVLAPEHQQFPFQMARVHRDMLMEGLDAIGLTLERQDEIARFEHHDRRKRPWCYLDPSPTNGVDEDVGPG
jgi:3-isopropylmalate/(R)-2-methylmalate dehydratase small subunit